MSSSIQSLLEGKNIQLHDNAISKLDKLYGHMVKFQYQPYNQSASWCGSIVDAYNELGNLRSTKGALKLFTKEEAEKAYQKSIKDIVIKDTNMKPGQYPDHLPDGWDPVTLASNKNNIINFMEKYAVTNSAVDWLDRNKYKFK